MSQELLPCQHVNLTLKLGGYICKKCRKVVYDFKATPPQDKLLPWQEAYAQEFHKHYDGILSKEDIEKSIQWNLEFMGIYMSQATPPQKPKLSVQWPEAMNQLCSKHHKPMHSFTCAECASIFSYNQAIEACKQAFNQ